MTATIIRLHEPPAPAQFTALERLRFVAWEDSARLLDIWLPLTLQGGPFPAPAVRWRQGMRAWFHIDPWPARADRWQGRIEWHEQWSGARGDDMIGLAAHLSGLSYRQAAQRLARMLGQQHAA